MQKPKEIFLTPGGYYRLNPPNDLHKIKIYTEDKGWHEVQAYVHHDPDDSDNYDHEQDPNTSGVNGDMA